MTPDRIKEQRKKAGYTQKQLGQLLGVAQTTIAGWENGSRSVTVDVVRDIAKALNIPVSSLLPEETQRKAEQIFHESKEARQEYSAKFDDAYFMDCAYNDALLDEYWGAVDNAEILSTHKIMESLKDVPDSFLLKVIVDCFNSMNKAGKYDLLRYARMISDSGNYDND